MDEEKRKVAMLATPVIDITFDGKAFNIITNTDDHITLMKQNIGEEFEYDFKDLGGVQTVHC